MDAALDGFLDAVVANGGGRFDGFINFAGAEYSG
jgi:hypothetical protein